MADVTLPRLVDRKDNLASLIYKLSQPDGAIDAIELCARNYVAALSHEYLKKAETRACYRRWHQRRKRNFTNSRSD